MQTIDQIFQAQIEIKKSTFYPIFALLKILKICL